MLLLGCNCFQNCLNDATVSCRTSSASSHVPCLNTLTQASAPSSCLCHKAIRCNGDRQPPRTPTSLNLFTQGPRRCTRANKSFGHHVAVKICISTLLSFSSTPAVNREDVTHIRPVAGLLPPLQLLLLLPGRLDKLNKVFLFLANSSFLSYDFVSAYPFRKMATERKGRRTSMSVECQLEGLFKQ